MSKSRKLRESTKKIIAYNQTYKCAICKILLPPSFQCDHIIPHAISLDDSNENLQALCGTCHSNKSQRENIRISQFKNLISKHPNLKICWFCLETTTENVENHYTVCGKVVKDIELILKKQNDILTEYKDIYNKYKYTRKNMEKITTDFKKITINNDILNIVIDKNYIYVNNYICRVNNNFTVNDITEAVFISTRSKQEYYKYSKILIKLVIDGTEQEKISCIDYLSENLPDYIPTRILNKDIDIEFEFSYI